MKTITKHFNVSNAISCGDPCYSSPEFTVSAKKGKWIANVDHKDCGMWGRRVSRITVHHKDFSPIGNKYELKIKHLPVDSGQVGVFSNSYDGQEVDFYSQCCSASSNESGFGYVGNGFVSSSGYGDGYYRCKIFKQNGVAVGVEITFIVD